MVGELQNWEVFSRPQEEELEWLVLCEGAVSCHIYDYSDVNETWSHEEYGSIFEICSFLDK